jgi:hypothetical protein
LAKWKLKKRREAKQATMLDDRDSLLGLVKQHLCWYPRMELRDIYKLLYQGVMGSEHMNPSPDEFTRRLLLEYKHLLPDSHERLHEPVRPDQTLLRVNLRPYKNRQGGIDALITPLLETARTIRGDLIQLKSTWLIFTQLCEQGQLTNFKITEIHRFSRWLNTMEFPMVHHSETYRREYQPAYRLVAAKFVAGLGFDNAG